jgi:DNA-binding PadR family transcriptional regulator
MNGYGLTDDQEKLLRLVVECDEEDQFFEKGFLSFLLGDDKYTLWGCDIQLDSLANLEALCDVNLLNKEQGKPKPVYRITNAGRDAVANNFQLPPTSPAPQVSIGAFIQNMSGGNIQAVGSARDSEIRQIVNDPDSLRSQVEKLSTTLLDEVKPALNASEFVDYRKAIRELQEQISIEKPNPLLIKRLIQTIGLLGDVDGSIELMTKVWPIIQILLLFIAAKLR